SDVTLGLKGSTPSGYFGQLQTVPLDTQGGPSRWNVLAKESLAPKCVRCWHHRADVGTHAEHPELCGRCIENVDGGGETRRWF
ncbi:MAG: zinc finger domain-containing protein, partial [Rhodanobacteraceae bacterium]